MRGGIIGLVVVLAVAALSGCAQREVSTPVVSKSKQAVSAGGRIVMLSGLTFVVPEGWTANTTTYGSPYGDLRATECLQLESLEATDGPKSVMVFSSADSSISASLLDSYGRDTFTAVVGTDSTRLYVGKPGTPYEPKRLMAAVTHLPGAATGIVFFAGSPGDPQASLGRIAEIFDVVGL